jgi:hypothetical protein
LRTVNATKVHIPSLISYCAPSTIALLLLAQGASYSMQAQLRLLIVTISLPLGILLGLLLYLRLGREAVRYDDKGFSIIKGKRVLETHDWSEFAEASLHTDSGSGINVRLYLQPDGKYVDIPATKTGLDPFTLRDSLLVKLSKH